MSLTNRFIRVSGVLVALVVCIFLARPASAAVIDKGRALAAETFWDNRDFAWYGDTIPFFECPDAELVTTWYYRWELVTKHLTYGSPESGYSFTEFTDRPFWSGAYGAISCPAGHQLYEVRWLRDPRYARDYARYWFRTPGAQPRNYGCWLADGVWAVHQVHPDAPGMVDLLPDLVKNYEAWEKRQFVPEVGLFWQNGHDDGMEFNINSRQTTDILRGAPGFRPGFNAYMWADALAIARTARLKGDESLASAYERKAAGLKDRLQTLLWDPVRQFYFPMSMREEKDKEGHVVRKHSLTYQSGRFAGSPHGREEHGYVPWQFRLPDPGREEAWKFLMDPGFFHADYGPTTVERHDPMFLLQKSCCWWSGQSWPYATSQTLKAMANVLQHYPAAPISADDYVKLLGIFSRSHRKDGKPYIAEALHPDTGSFEGHDGYNHSEHYFHSSFNDLVITGLVGLQTRDDDRLEIRPLAPASWPYFALDDLPYRGHLLTILWDRDGTRYGKGAGLRLLVNGKELAARADLGPLDAALPPASPQNPGPLRFNYAVNNDGFSFPRLSASFTGAKSRLDALQDGQCWYTVHPPNRWTTAGSGRPTDTAEIDFGMPRRIDLVRLAFLDDGGDLTVPASYALEFHDGTGWREIPGQQRSPAAPTGHLFTAVRFPAREIGRLRLVLNHAPGKAAGLSEIEAWGDGSLPYVPPPPKPGNLAHNDGRSEFPKASCSFHDVYGGVPKNANDGRFNFKPTPVNRWTSYGSPTPTDWLALDFGKPVAIGRVDVHLYDDRGGVQPPRRFWVEVEQDGRWVAVANERHTPAEPLGSGQNTAVFDRVTAQRLRVVFEHREKSKSGVTEVEVWNE